MGRCKSLRVTKWHRNKHAGTVRVKLMKSEYSLELITLYQCQCSVFFVLFCSPSWPGTHNASASVS
jgi:hypothetical protein